MFHFRFTGDRELKATMVRILSRYPDRVKSAVFLRAEIVMRRSKELAPVKTGFLKNSGRVERNRQGWVNLVYGASYAAAVHELHPTHSKFLERAMMEEAGRLMRELAMAAPLERTR